MAHLGGGSGPSGPPVFINGIKAGTGGGGGDPCKKAAAMAILMLPLLPVLIPLALYRKWKSKT